MNTIHKYELDRRYQSVPMPEGARILSVHDQRGHACVWALVDDTRPVKCRMIETYVTGAVDIPSPEDLIHLGTVLFEGGDYVVHVFERVARASQDRSI